MKIAQIICAFPPVHSGMGNSAYNFARVLADKEGYQITVFTPAYSRKQKLEPWLAQSAKYQVVKLKPLVKIGQAAVLPQLFWRLEGFDIVHLHYPFFGSAEIVLIKKILAGKKLKLVLHYHMDAKAFGAKGIIFSLYRFLVLPWLVRLAKIITCASIDYIKHSDLAAYYRHHQSKFKEISFGVNLQQFLTYQDNLNLPKKNKIILFVGGLDRAHYFKGLENLIKALNQIKKIARLKSTILKVVGNGDLINYYKKITANLGLTKAVNFYPNIDNSKLVDFYNYSDVLVLPSIGRQEAFGLVLLEAMACSKPVIASNLPGVRSVFKNGCQGLLVKPDDITDLANKLKIILENQSLAQAMGQAGRQLVENRYTWGKVGERLEIIYSLVAYTP